jgi:short-chain fatty acids transporter
MIKFFEKYIPSPLSIAFLLTILTFLLAFIFTRPSDYDSGQYAIKLTLDWQKGLWDTSTGGLYFGFQMMLILVLGHSLALTPFVSEILNRLTQYCTTTANSAFTIALSTMLVSYFNWGMGLIFGALLARKVGERFAAQQQPLNYGLIGAAAYSGMLIWHGGISGSAPTKAMEENAIRSMMENAGYQVSNQLPESVSIAETLFSSLNQFTALTLLVLVPLLLYYVGKQSRSHNIPAFPDASSSEMNLPEKKVQTFDRSNLFGTAIGLLIIATAMLVAWDYKGSSATGFISVNFINLSLLGLTIFLHRSIYSFLRSIDHAISDASGILIQFPLYFGIMGIMSGSGLIQEMSAWMTVTASPETFHVFSFLSAGLVNFFVPSGGGQWYIQGPMLIQSALDLGVSIPKTIMALSYGDQWTNMLQPFWALPLMGITRLKAGELLPYTFVLFLIGGIIFLSGLLLF